MRLFIILLPWLELFSLIQLGIKTSALFALGYVLLTLLLVGGQNVRGDARDIDDRSTPSRLHRCGGGHEHGVFGEYRRQDDGIQHARMIGDDECRSGGSSALGVARDPQAQSQAQ